MGFLVTYHSLSDAEAKSALSSYDFKEPSSVWKLLEILKDADALDRVRLGVHYLSLRYLRNPEALALTMAALELTKKDILSLTGKEKIHALWEE